MAQHNDLGKGGELIAVDYLKEKGYSILKQQYRYRKLEIDIIAKKGDLIIFVEVKTRAYSTVLAPEDSVTIKKRNFIIEAANHFLESLNLDLQARFDIIAIEINRNKKSIRHIEDAFNSIH